MKSSSSLHFRQLGSLGGLLGLSLTALLAQDEITLKNGQSRPGEVVGVSKGNVTLKVGPVQTSIPLNQVKSARVTPPKELAAANAALAAGKPDQALNILRPLVEKFGGLPVDWAQRAYVMLGEIQIQQGKSDEAGRTFEAFSKLYPESGSLAAVSVATLDVAKGNFPAAQQKLAPIVAEAATVQLADPERSATYGKAYLLMGRVHEAGGQFPEALENYLRTVTVFYADAAAVADARSRAEALVSVKNVIAP